MQDEVRDPEAGPPPRVRRHPPQGALRRTLEAGRYLEEDFREARSRDDGRVCKGLANREAGVQDPISGMSPTSFRPDEADLLAMVRDAGYRKGEVLGRDLVNRMPHITPIAE